MKKALTLLAALALLLALLTACGSKEAPQQPSAPDQPAEAQPEDTPSEDTQPAEAPAKTDVTPAEDTQPEETPSDADAQPAETQPEETPAGDVQPEETQPGETPAEETQPEADPAPEPESDPEPEPAPEPDPVFEDGTYTAEVTLEGGTGRAKVDSPAVLRCEGGKFWATIAWSSPNFDYMKVDGEKYELISEPGSNSVFEIPVAAFDQKLDVIADTVAMSEPHEVEYTLTFDSSTLQKQ